MVRQPGRGALLIDAAPGLVEKFLLHPEGASPIAHSFTTSNSLHAHLRLRMHDVRPSV